MMVNLTTAVWAIRAVVTIAIAGVAPVASAQDHEKTEVGAVAAQPLTLHTLGVQVAIDPVTGRLRPPTQAQARELARALRETYLDSPAAQAPVIEHPDGSLTQILDARHRFHALARLGERGELQRDCVAGEAYLQVLGPASSASPAADDPVRPAAAPAAGAER